MLNYLKKLKTKTTNLRRDIHYSSKYYFKLLRPIYKSFRFGFYFITNHVYRNDRIFQIIYRNKIFQPNSYTIHNRYPDLFTICKNHFNTAFEPLKIMSFGCATGEEVLSLNQYLPNASIVGVDINLHNLKICQKKNPNPKLINFIHSLSQEFLLEDNYNAIFCLAVLQHTYNRNPKTQIAKYMTFNRFDEIITILDQKLKIGGLLIIDQADFNFLDTRVASYYLPLAVSENLKKRDRPLYNSQNIKIANTSFTPRIFIKIKLAI